MAAAAACEETERAGGGDPPDALALSALLRQVSLDARQGVISVAEKEEIKSSVLRTVSADVAAHAVALLKRGVTAPVALMPPVDASSLETPLAPLLRQISQCFHANLISQVEKSRLKEWLLTRRGGGGETRARRFIALRLTAAGALQYERLAQDRSTQSADVLQLLFSFLDLESLTRCAAVSRLWRRVSTRAPQWRRVYFQGREKAGSVGSAPLSLPLPLPLHAAEPSFFRKSVVVRNALERSIGPVGRRLRGCVYLPAVDCVTPGEAPLELGGDTGRHLLERNPRARNYFEQLHVAQPASNSGCTLCKLTDREDSLRKRSMVDVEAQNPLLSLVTDATHADARHLFLHAAGPCTLLAGHRPDGTVEVWDADSKQALRSVAPVEPHWVRERRRSPLDKSAYDEKLEELQHAKVMAQMTKYQRFKAQEQEELAARAVFRVPPKPVVLALSAAAGAVACSWTLRSVHVFSVRRGKRQARAFDSGVLGRLTLGGGRVASLALHVARAGAEGTPSLLCCVLLATGDLVVWDVYSAALVLTVPQGDECVVSVGESAAGAVRGVLAYPGDSEVPPLPPPQHERLFADMVALPVIRYRPVPPPPTQAAATPPDEPLEAPTLQPCARLLVARVARRTPRTVQLVDVSRAVVSRAFVPHSDADVAALVLYQYRQEEDKAAPREGAPDADLERKQWVGVVVTLHSDGALIGVTTAGRRVVLSAPRQGPQSANVQSRVDADSGVFALFRHWTMPTELFSLLSLQRLCTIQFEEAALLHAMPWQLTQLAANAYMVSVMVDGVGLLLWSWEDVAKARGNVEAASGLSPLHLGSGLIDALCGWALAKDALVVSLIDGSLRWFCPLGATRKPPRCLQFGVGAPVVAKLPPLFERFGRVRDGDDRFVLVDFVGFDGDRRSVYKNKGRLVNAQATHTQAPISVWMPASQLVQPSSQGNPYKVGDIVDFDVALFESREHSGVMAPRFEAMRVEDVLGPLIMLRHGYLELYHRFDSHDIRPHRR